jgi:hypothetical protein
MIKTFSLDSLMLKDNCSPLTVNNSQLSVVPFQSQVNNGNHSNHNFQEPMDLDNANNHEIKIFEPTLQKNSLLLASFPWFSTVIMMPKTLSENFRTNTMDMYVLFTHLPFSSSSIAEVYF